MIIDVSWLLNVVVIVNIVSLVIWPGVLLRDFYLPLAVCLL